MAPMHVRLKAAFACVVLSTSIVSGQQAIRPGGVSKAARPTTVNASAQRVGRNTLSLITGVVVTNERTPLRNARVRLRNLDANEIEQAAIANERGEFSFAARPNISYVVEIADQAGRVVAVGDVILLSPGEVAGAVVSLPARLPALTGVFDDTASSVISAATSTGLTVVDPSLPKVSPRE